MAFGRYAEDIGKFRSGRVQVVIVLNQLFVKTLSARISIFCYKGTLVNTEGRRVVQHPKISPFLIFMLRISFANSNVSVTVYWFTDKGFSFVSSHLDKA